MIGKIYTVNLDKYPLPVKRVCDSSPTKIYIERYTYLF